METSNSAKKLLEEFENPYSLALNSAILKAYADPTISEVLVGTGEFVQNSRKRLQRTGKTLRNLIEGSSEERRGAVKRMNNAHSIPGIHNEQMLYVLSLFTFEPLKWIESYGHRPLREEERQGHYDFWREVGSEMGILHIPTTYEKFSSWQKEYIDHHITYHPNNKILAETAVNSLAQRSPLLFNWTVRNIFSALLEPEYREAFGYRNYFKPLTPALEGLMKKISAPETK